MKLLALKNMLSYGVAICVMKGTSLLMLPIVTRYLSPKEYGQLEILSISCTFLALIISCSLHEALYRFASLSGINEKKGEYHSVKIKYRKARNRANKIFTLSFFIPFCLLITWISFSLLFYENIEKAVSIFNFKYIDLVFASLSLCIGSSLAIAFAWLRNLDKVKHFTQIAVVSTLCQALLVILFLELNLKVTGVLLAAVLVHIMQWLWLVKLTKLQIQLPSKLLIKKIFKYSIPLGASSIVALGLNGAERWFILYSTSLETLGQYAIASKFALATCILVQPFSLWWMPKRFALLEQNSKQAEKISLLGIIYIGFLIIAVAMLSQLMLPILLTDEYLISTTLILGALFMVLGKELTEMVNLGLLQQKHTHTLFKIHSFSTLLGLLSCFLFIEFGLWSVILSVGVAQLIKALWVFVASQNQCPIFANVKVIFIVPLLVILTLSMMYFATSLLVIGFIGFSALIVLGMLAFLLLRAKTLVATYG